MLKRTQRTLVLAAAVAMATGGILSSMAQASNVNWKDFTAAGGTSQNWSVTGSWTGGSIPSVTDTSMFLSFDPAQSNTTTSSGKVNANYTSNNDLGTVQLNQLILAGSPITSNSYTATITGGTLDFENPGATILNTTGTSANGNTTNYMQYSIGSAVTLGTNLTLQINGSGNTTFTNTISGTGYGLIKNGSGVATFSNSQSTFDGGVTLNAGTLRLSASSYVTSGTLNGGPLGKGTVTLAGGTLQEDGTTRTIANNIIFTGDTAFSSTNNNSTSITLDGTTLTTPATVTLNSNPVLSVNTTGTPTSAVLTIKDVIKDGTGSSITKAGGGYLLLQAANTFSGGVTLNGGILRPTVNTSVTSGSIVSGALGTGTLTLISGSLQDNNDPRTLANNVVLAGDVTFATNGSAANAGFIFDGTTLNTPATFKLMQPNPTMTIQDSVTINNPIQNGTINNTAFTKAGTGNLYLAGSNNYTGGTTITGGFVQFSNTSAVPASGQISVTGAGALRVAGAYTTVQDWLTTGKIAASSNGTIALNGASSSENIDFTGYTNLMLGSATNTTYTGTITPANSTYRLGGGGYTLTLSNANALTGTTNNLVVGNSSSSGTVALTNANDLAGTTTIKAGTLKLSTFAGTLANSDITAATGTTLAVDSASGTAAPSVTRAKSLTLNGATFTVTGTTSANTSDIITNAITLGPGSSTITLTTNASKTVQLNAANLTRSAMGGTAFINGVGLGKDSTSNANLGRIILGTTPTLVGNTDALSTGINASAKDTKIVPYLVGEATSTTGGVGTASGSANTFLTYNATTGLRPLNPTDEFTNNAITAGMNTRITSSSTASSSTSINSLVIAGGDLIVADAMTLTNTSGALLFVNGNTIKPNTSGASTGTLAFGSTEGIITANSGITGTISAPITGTAGLTKNGAGALTLSASNSGLSGGVTLNTGTLNISNAGALGTGTFTINGGNINGGVTVSTSNPQIWNGNFGTTSGTIQTVGLGTGSVTMTNNITINISSYNTLSVGGVINDGGNGYNLTISGSGNAPVALSGANTFSGGLTLASGSLKISNNQALGTGTFTILGGSMTQTTGGALTGVSNQVWKGDFGLDATSGAINLGTASVSMFGTRAITVNNGGATIGGAISGAGSSLNYKGTQYNNSLTLTGINTFDGGFTLTPGSATATLAINNASALGTGTFTIVPGGGGTAVIDNNSANAITLSTNNAMAWNNNFTFTGTKSLNLGTGNVTMNATRTVTANASTLTVGGTISDGGNGYGLTKAGAGILALTGNNTYSGPTTITAGTITLSTLTNAGAASTLGQSSSAAANLILNGGTLQYTGIGTSTDRLFTINPTNGTIDASGASNAAVTFANTGSVVSADAASRTGTTAVSTTISGLSSTADLVVGMSVTGANIPAGTTIASIASSTSITLSVAATGAGVSNLTFGPTNRTLTLTGSSTGTNTMASVLADSALGGKLNVTKTGTGKWLLSGNNTYTGTTTVSAGTMQYSSDANLGLGQLVLGAATLQPVGTSPFSSTRSINTSASGTIDTSYVTDASFGTVNLGSYTLTLNGNANVSLTGTGTGSVTKNGTGALTFTGSSTYTGSTNVNAGSLNLSGFGATGSSNIILSTNVPLAIDSNNGTYASSVTRANNLTLKGNNVTVTGSSLGTTNDVFTGALGFSGGLASTLTLTSESSTNNATQLSAASMTRSAGTGTLLVKGVNLGMDSTSTTNVTRLLVTSAPTLTGTTDALATGINAAAKNTKIVPYLLGESGTNSGQTGTVTGTANTFMTWNATTGLRPLNPTDEFTNNAVTSGNNTRINSYTTANSTTAINSLIMAGNTLAIGSSATVSDTSGAVLFAGSSTISGGYLAFGSTEAIITVNSGISGTIYNAISTGTAGLTKNGLGNLTFSGGTPNITGTTTINGGTVTFAGAYSTAGGINVNAGTLKFTGWAGAADAAAIYVASGATLDYSGIAGDDWLKNFKGAGNVITPTGHTLWVSGNGDTFSGVLSGSGTISQGGTGNYTLSGTNTFTGTWVVSGSGAVTYLTGVDSLAQAQVQVKTSGKLDLYGTNQSIKVLSDGGSTSGIITNSTASTTSTLSISGTANSSYGGTLVDTGTGKIALAKTGSGVLTLASTANAFTGGTSITGGTLIVQGSLAGTTNNFLGNVNVATSLILSNGKALSDVTSQLATSRSSTGAWSGTTGIYSSAAAAANTLAGSEVYGLAAATGLQLHNLGMTTFGPNNLAFNDSDVLVKYTYVGDANLDGTITMDDYLAIDTGYLFDGSGYTAGDFDYSGTINAADYVLIDNAYKKQGGPMADEMINLHASWFGAEYTDAFNALAAPVPEPASLLLLGVGALSLLKRRR